MSVLEYVHARQLGVAASCAVTPSSVVGSLYKSLKRRSSTKVANADTSAVNNVEFSSDGQLLVAVTADRCVMLLDPVTRKQVNCIYQAHDSSINDICFIEERTFATCGDDNAVHVWDARKLGTRVVSLNSHGSWVKSVQRVHNENALLTCSLDGSLILWDLSGGRGSPMQGTYNRRVLLMPGVVRASLSPQADRLALTTTGGYVLLVHHLNLNTLHRLLDGFLPIVYRSMYHTKTPMPTMMKFNHLFAADRKENRLEFIDERPLTKFTIVTAAKFHPYGQYLMTRNWHRNTSIEHTCVYDVTGNGYWHPKKAAHFDQIKRSREGLPQAEEQGETIYAADGEPMALLDVLQSVTRLEEVHIHSAYHRRYSVHSSGIPPPAALINAQSQEPAASPSWALLEEPPLKLNDPDLNPCGPTPPAYYHHKRLIGCKLEERVLASSHTIKENCWSPDGQVIASPSGNKVNVYAFDRGKVPLPYTRDDMPVSGDVHLELPSVATLTQAKQPNVVCTRFRPRQHIQLVAGDHSGKVLFYEPTFF